MTNKSVHVSLTPCLETFHLAPRSLKRVVMKGGEGRKGKERKGKERKDEERKGKERKGKERASVIGVM